MIEIGHSVAALVDEAAVVDDRQSKTRRVGTIPFLEDAVDLFGGNARRANRHPPQHAREPPNGASRTRRCSSVHSAVDSSTAYRLRRRRPRSFTAASTPCTPPPG